MGRAFRENDDVARFGGIAQPIDQLAAGTARKAVHAHGRMAGIIEVVDHLERQAVTVRKPLDQRRRARRHGLDDGTIRLAFRLALDVGGEQIRAVSDAFVALKACAGSRDETG